MSHLSNPHERIRELSSSAIVNNNIKYSGINKFNKIWKR